MSVKPWFALAQLTQLLEFNTTQSTTFKVSQQIGFAKKKSFKGMYCIINQTMIFKQVKVYILKL